MQGFLHFPACLKWFAHSHAQIILLKFDIMLCFQITKSQDLETLLLVIKKDEYGCFKG
jgi:hypothetical protein